MAAMPSMIRVRILAPSSRWNGLIPRGRAASIAFIPFVPFCTIATPERAGCVSGRTGAAVKAGAIVRTEKSYVRQRAKVGRVARMARSFGAADVANVVVNLTGKHVVLA